MITDLTVVEQRHRAVLEVLEHGAKITDVAREILGHALPPFDLEASRSNMATPRNWGHIMESPKTWGSPRKLDN